MGLVRLDGGSLGECKSVCFITQLKQCDIKRFCEAGALQ